MMRSKPQHAKLLKAILSGEKVCKYKQICSLPDCKKCDSTTYDIARMQDRLNHKNATIKKCAEIYGRNG